MRSIFIVLALCAVTVKGSFLRAEETYSQQIVRESRTQRIVLDFLRENLAPRPKD